MSDSQILVHNIELWFQLTNDILADILTKTAAVGKHEKSVPVLGAMYKNDMAWPFDIGYSIHLLLFIYGYVCSKHSDLSSAVFYINDCQAIFV